MIITVTIDNNLERRIKQHAETITARTIARQSHQTTTKPSLSIAPSPADIRPVRRAAESSPPHVITGEP